ncbi:MAG: hypothetical protein AB8F78_05145 [Saprospiraceae bacterium]
MSRRLVTINGEERRMERKSGKPRGEPDYYHDLVTNNTYLLDDPRISEPVELEEREV